MKICDIYLESISANEVKIIEFDPEYMEDEYDPWLLADEADEIAEQTGIRIARNKELTHLAIADDGVVGAVWSDLEEDREQDAWVYDFDIAVRPQFHGQASIFQRLMDYTLARYQDLLAENPRTYIRVWVVNPRLVNVLERKYDFEIESEHGDGSAHMTYYGA